MKKPRGKTAITVLIAFSLIASVFFVYRRTLDNGFVWDDIPYLLENRHVHDGLTLAGMKWAFTSMERCNWHPLTWISTMVDCGLYGPKPWGHHLTSVLFHAANSVLLMLVLTRMTGSIRRSGLVAALFAVHPLHVESVAWIAERKDVLSTFFLFLTILAYLHYVRRPSGGRYSLVALLFAMGLMAKPMLVTLPLMLLLLDYWPLGRFSKDRPAMALILEKIPLFMLSAASSAVTYIAQQRSHAVAPYALDLRIENALLSYLRYIGKMLWPSGLAVHYPFPEHGIPAWLVIGASAGLIAISVAVVLARKQRPYLLWGWLWYVITLVPVIGIVQVGGQSMADRYTYVPLIGLFVALVWAIPKFTRAGTVLASGIMVALMLCSVLQVSYWRTDEALFRRVLSVNDSDAMAHNYLGVILAMQGNLRAGGEHFARALALDPDYPAAHVNMGDLRLARGDVAQARAHFQEALKSEPHNKEALARMAEIDRE